MICSWKCALCVERVCWFDLEATFIDSTKSSLCIIIWCVQWLRHCCCIIFLKRQDTLLYITTSLKLSLSKRSNIKHIATGRVFLDKVWRLNLANNCASAVLSQHFQWYFNNNIGPLLTSRTRSRLLWRIWRNKVDWLVSLCTIWLPCLWN